MAVLLLLEAVLSEHRVLGLTQHQQRPRSFVRHSPMLRPEKSMFLSVAKTVNLNLYFHPQVWCQSTCNRKQHQRRVRKRDRRRTSSPSRTAGWIRLCRSSRCMMGFIPASLIPWRAHLGQTRQLRANRVKTGFVEVWEWGYKVQHLYVFVINCHILGSISLFCLLGNFMLC